MYRKTAIALALGATTAAPLAHAADFQVSDSTTFTVYGTIEPRLNNEKDANGDSSTEFKDNDSTLGFEGEHAFNDTVSSFARAEFEYDSDEENDDGLDSVDEAFVGINGGFGTIRFGSADTLYEDEISELLDECENACPAEERNNGEGNQITYWSPSFGGFSFAAEMRFLGEGEDENPTGSSENGLEVVGMYDMDTWGLVAGYSDSATAESGGQFVDESVFGFGGWVEFGNMEFRGRYGVQDNAPDSSEGDSTDFVGALVGYDYGKGDVNLFVQEVSPDLGDSRTEIGAIIKHGLFDNLDIYLEAGKFDQPNDEGDLVEVGAIFSF